MKKYKITYWITTGIIALMMLFSAYGYFTNPDMKLAFVHLGFPDYFRIELGIAKLIGAIILIVPKIPTRVKEFAYAGFVITFISAFIAHTASGDPLSTGIMAIIFLGILIASYISYHKITPIS
tara:strand:+ start:4114 stop:4482 length:369 start_codon:yes stop_codon:yes gene_type:complete